MTPWITIKEKKKKNKKYRRCWEWHTLHVTLRRYANISVCRNHIFVQYLGQLLWNNEICDYAFAARVHYFPPLIVYSELNRHRNVFQKIINFKDSCNVRVQIVLLACEKKINQLNLLNTRSNCNMENITFIWINFTISFQFHKF